MPFDSLFSGGRERCNVRVRPARERRIPVRARTHRRENARGATDMIGMWMRKHERIERAAAPEEIRKHRRATRIAAAPRGTRIEQKPVSGIRSKEDRVALSDVENMELDTIAA